jgi:hypothetical protein
MPMIRECIVTTLSEEGKVHIAPLGLIAEEGGWIIAPFRPSTTLDNLSATPFAVANFTDDVLVFAGCLLGRRDWPTRLSTHVPGAVLEGALTHVELAVAASGRTAGPAPLPRGAWASRPVQGFNRAGAVIEPAITRRLHVLPREKIERELGYLQIVMEKTAGPREHEAWRLLVEKIEDHYKQTPG